MSARAERPSWLDDRLFPFESRFIEIAGHRVHYVDEGHGPTLLLLHGNPTWSFLYRHLIASLRDGFRCVAPDYPGFGLSTAQRGYGFRPREHCEILERFLLELDLHDIVLFVQDWGGPIGLGIAVRHPERFRGLVVANTWAWPVDGDPHFERFSKLMGGSVGRLLIRHFNAFVTLVMPRGILRRTLSPEEWNHYRMPFASKESRFPTHVFPREILASRDFLAAVLGGLGSLRHLPAILVWADRDIAFREKELRRWQEIFPGAVTLPLPGAGHFVQEDASDEIAAAIRKSFAADAIPASNASAT